MRTRTCRGVCMCEPWRRVSACSYLYMWGFVRGMRPRCGGKGGWCLGCAILSSAGISWCCVQNPRKMVAQHEPVRIVAPQHHLGTPVHAGMGVPWTALSPVRPPCGVGWTLCSGVVEDTCMCGRVGLLWWVLWGMADGGHCMLVPALCSNQGC